MQTRPAQAVLTETSGMDQGSSVRVPKHSAPMGPNLKFQNLKQNKRDEGNVGGGVCQLTLEEQWKEPVMFRPEGGETAVIVIFSPTMKECHMQIEGHLLCSLAAGELRSVCRNYKEGVFGPV